MNMTNGRRHYSGSIDAISDTKGLRGTERFSVSVAPDGSRTLHATCEIFDRNVSKDIIYSVDRDFRPMDSYVRLIKDGSLLGSGRYHFDDRGCSLDCDSRVLGRVTQRIDQAGGFPSFGPHPLTGDIWHLARYDHSSKEKVQFLDSSLSSLEHDGCSGPMLHPVRFGIEFLGPKTITVPAGTFETHHYQFHLDGTLPQEHPREHLWCIPGDFIFVQIRVDGYMSTTYQLTELVR
jgi:hypothetical protein